MSLDGKLKQLVGFIVDDCVDQKDHDATYPDDATKRAFSDFLIALPSDWPLAAGDLSVDLDGAFSIEWMLANHRRLSVSIHGNRKLPYAWINEDARGHGVAILNGVEMPTELLSIMATLTARPPPQRKHYEHARFR